MRKRLTSAALEKLEAVISEDDGATFTVFGICDLNQNVIRKVKLTDVGPVETDEEPTQFISEKLERLLYPKRFKIIWGGRGSGKTKTVVKVLKARALARTERVSCFREIQNSIKDSSKQEIADEIIADKEGDKFVVLDTLIRCPATNSLFTFGGLFRNVTKTKGIANGTISWTEEAENVTAKSWEVIRPTFRKKGSEIWVTFNPSEETDATWLEWIKPYEDKLIDGCYEDEDTLIIRCNHSDNPWLTDELKLERDLMRKRDPDKYLHIWEGQFRKVSNIKVLNGKWRIDEFEPAQDWDGPYYGADFGFAEDPSTLNRVWIYNEKLYIEYEANGKHVELDDMPAFYDQVPESRTHIIRADSSRPETISHIKRKGFMIESVDKWPGSVEDGITYLRSFDEIIIHPRCTNTIIEANAYQYKTDNAGNPLPVILDKNNHHMDAIRYALAQHIRKVGKGFFDY